MRFFKEDHHGVGCKVGKGQENSRRGFMEYHSVALIDRKHQNRQFVNKRGRSYAKVVQEEQDHASFNGKGDVKRSNEKWDSNVS